MDPALTAMMNTPVRFRDRQPANTPKGGFTWSPPGPTLTTHFELTSGRHQANGQEVRTKVGSCWLDPDQLAAIGWTPAAGDVVVLPDSAEWPVTEVQTFWDENGAVDHYEVTFGPS